MRFFVSHLVGDVIYIYICRCVYGGVEDPLEVILLICIHRTFNKPNEYSAVRLCCTRTFVLCAGE